MWNRSKLLICFDALILKAQKTSVSFETRQNLRSFKSDSKLTFGDKDTGAMCGGCRTSIEPSSSTQHALLRQLPIDASASATFSGADEDLSQV